MRLSALLWLTALSALSENLVTAAADDNRYWRGGRRVVRNRRTIKGTTRRGDDHHPTRRLMGKNEHRSENMNQHKLVKSEDTSGDASFAEVMPIGDSSSSDLGPTSNSNSNNNATSTTEEAVSTDGTIKDSVAESSANDMTSSSADGNKQKNDKETSEEDSAEGMASSSSDGNKQKDDKDASLADSAEEVYVESEDESKNDKGNKNDKDTAEESESMDEVEVHGSDSVEDFGAESTDAATHKSSDASVDDSASEPVEAPAQSPDEQASDDSDTKEDKMPKKSKGGDKKSSKDKMKETKEDVKLSMDEEEDSVEESNDKMKSSDFSGKSKDKEDEASVDEPAEAPAQTPNSEASMQKSKDERKSKGSHKMMASGKESADESAAEPVEAPAQSPDESLEESKDEGKSKKSKGGDKNPSGKSEAGSVEDSVEAPAQSPDEQASEDSEEEKMSKKSKDDDNKSDKHKSKDIKEDSIEESVEESADEIESLLSGDKKQDKDTSTEGSADDIEYGSTDKVDKESSMEQESGDGMESGDEPVEAPAMASVDEASEDDKKDKGKGKGDDSMEEGENFEFESSGDIPPPENSGDEVTGSPLSTGTTAPSSLPVEMPSTDAPIATDSAGTDAPGTDSPATDAPGTDLPATELPTFTPTEEVQPGEDLNDQCTMAAAISVGETVTGSTIGALASDVEACWSALGGSSAAPGLWYTISGTGTGMRASVNSTFDMQLSVFLGPGCDSLSCIAGTAGETFPYSFGDVSWAADTGQEYLILVNGWETGEGEFELTISEGDIPPNSICETATLVESGDEIQGTTDFSRVADVEPCGEFSSISVTAPTNWYSIIGNGEFIQVNVFAEDFDTQISIYLGDCGALTCVDANDDSSFPGPQSSLSVFLEEGLSYSLLVHGYNNAAGEYAMDINPVESAENDECTSATVLSFGSSESGSTLAATPNSDLSFCGVGTNESSVGVWYSLVGNGGAIEASVNDTSSLAVSVYSGTDCNALACVASNDRPEFPLDWDSIDSEQYFIYVYAAYTSLKDTFDITVREVVRPENDQCEDADPLQIDAPAIVGTTESSSIKSDLEACGDVFDIGFGGVWYSVIGSGDVLLVGINTGRYSPFTGFDPQVSVYSGSCDELICVDGNDEGTRLGYASAVAFEATEGEEYFVLVHGFGLSRGDFTIEALTVVRPTNDACETAISLETGDTVAGATYFAQQSDDFEFETCGTSQGGNFSSPGVWYTVGGSGGLMGASINANYDVQMTVFAGGCSDLTCVDGTEGFTIDFFSGAVYWDSEEGVDYSVLVHGFTGQVGEFEFFTASVERPPNDRCTEAIVIEVGDRIAGSNQFASLETLPECGADVPTTGEVSSAEVQIDEAPTVWYTFSFQGDLPSSNVFSLATFLTDSDFSHQIVVSEGESCDVLTCVAYGVSGEEPANVEWVPVSGDTYWIAVSGYGEERGEYELSLYAVENVV